MFLYATRFYYVPPFTFLFANFVYQETNIKRAHSVNRAITRYCFPFRGARRPDAASPRTVTAERRDAGY